MVEHYFKKNFNGIKIKQYNGKVTGVTGNEVKVQGVVEIKTKDCMILKFLLIPQKLFILGLDNLRTLNFQLNLTLACDISHIPTDLSVQIAECSNLTGGMKITPLEIDYSGQPVFCKSRQVPLGLREAIKSS